MSLFNSDFPRFHRVSPQTHCTVHSRLLRCKNIVRCAFSLCLSVCLIHLFHSYHSWLCWRPYPGECMMAQCLSSPCPVVGPPLPQHAPLPPNSPSETCTSLDLALQVTLHHAVSPAFYCAVLFTVKWFTLCRHIKAHLHHPPPETCTCCCVEPNSCDL